MTIYVPGTDEKDPKKVIMSLQQNASSLTTAQTNIATNTSNIATNTANIATNTTNIASNTSAITALQTSLAALIPTGTLMLFQQTSAPTGWTKVVTYNDAALRVVSGTASSGGANGFSTVMAQTTVGSHTLTTAEIPAHTHTYSQASSSGLQVTTVVGGTAFHDTNTTVNSGSAGTGGAHNHTITMNMAYVDIIIASKN